VAYVLKLLVGLNCCYLFIRVKNALTNLQWHENYEVIFMHSVCRVKPNVSRVCHELLPFLSHVAHTRPASAHRTVPSKRTKVHLLLDCMFCRDIFEVFAPLGCYTTCVDTCVPTFRDSLSAPSSRGLDCLGLENGTDMISRNALNNYPNVQRNVLEEQRHWAHRCWWWKPLKAQISWPRILPENSRAQFK
jgi:hypothetical protein